MVMNKTFRNLGFGFIGLILVLPFIKIPSYPDVFMKASDLLFHPVLLLMAIYR